MELLLPILIFKGEGKRDKSRGHLAFLFLSVMAFSTPLLIARPKSSKISLWSFRNSVSGEDDVEKRSKEGNGIYVVSVGNALLVKRVDFDTVNKAIILISANPAYPPRPFSGYDLQDLRISGRVLACVHRV